MKTKLYNYIKKIVAGMAKPLVPLVKLRYLNFNEITEKDHL